MKSLIRKLIPGVVATLVATALGMYCMASAQMKATTPGDGAQPAAQSPYAAAPVYNQAPSQAPQQIMVCGVCGARLQPPQVVMVAQGYPDERPRQARAEYSERYAVDACYPQAAAACVEPVAYAPAYYQRPLSVDPFSEIRVNPIPFPYQTRAVYAPPPGREYYRR